jgi:hypothetical protein
MLKLIECIRNLTHKPDVPNIRKELRWLTKQILAIGVTARVSNQKDSTSNN